MTTKINSKKIVKECIDIIETAERENVVLRAMGAIAFRLHCPDSWNYFEALNRELTDVDLITLSEFNNYLDELLQKFGWRSVKWLWGRKEFALMYKRRMFEKENIRMDVFFDEIAMCHRISLRDRLSIDKYTIPLADMMLEKLQIVKINEKDIKDIIILLKDHDIGAGSSPETIDAEYIANILSKDWGFYYTVTQNLNKIRRHFLNEFPVLTSDEKTEVGLKIDKLLEIIEKKPKTLAWKIRAKIGTRKRWYEEVEEIR
jgi:hypothetical protein